MKREPPKQPWYVFSSFEREMHLLPYKAAGRCYELFIRVKAYRRHKDCIARRARRIGKK